MDIFSNLKNKVFGNPKAKIRSASEESLHDYRIRFDEFKKAVEYWDAKIDKLRKQYKFSENKKFTVIIRLADFHQMVTTSNALYTCDVYDWVEIVKKVKFKIPGYEIINKIAIPYGYPNSKIGAE